MKIYQNKKITTFTTIPLLSLLAVFVVMSFLGVQSGATDKSSAIKKTGDFNKVSSLKSFNNNSSYSDFKSSNSNESSKGYVDGVVLVKFKETKIDLKTTSGLEKAFNFAKDVSVEKTEDLKTANISVLKITDGKTVEAKVAELEADPNVEYAQPNYIKYASAISTNDTLRTSLWGLDNTGQTVTTPGNTFTGIADADIDAPEAWAINQGTNASVIVAVLDTGVAYNHPDLINQMWNGSSCRDENNSTLGACVHGYDYENNDKIPLPDSLSHGTHVAGIIAAQKNNSKGVIGIAPNVKIMALKFAFDDTSEIKAIDFANINGAKVINASFGGGYFSQAEYDAINRFRNVGGIFVAAAGNSSMNNDMTYGHSYPSDYNLDNIISVAATDAYDDLAYFSNYGTVSVDVGAPGEDILSTVGEMDILTVDFQSVTTPALPAGWTTGGTNNKWGTAVVNNDIALYSQRVAPPYDNNTDSYVTSPTYNWTTAVNGVVPKAGNLFFRTECDTEYASSSWYDYMEIQFSADGVNFTTMMRWDEYVLDMINDDPMDETGSASAYVGGPIPTEPTNFLTSSFKYRFRWVTDGSGNSYRGCSVDDIILTGLGDGSAEKYEFYSGTSMAAPYVTGLVGLVRGYQPNLTYSRVKDVVVNSGDTKSSLSGIVSGKRINAQKALIESTVQGKVYQSHVGTDGKVYTRSSANGISWSKWGNEMANAPGEATAIPITMTSMGNTLYQSHVGTDRKIYSRSSTNGSDWTVWTREMTNAPGEATIIPITMASVNVDGKLYQSHVGTDKKIYTRSSTNGINWTVWTREMTNAPGEATIIPITMASVDDTLFQSHVGTDGKVYTRSSINGINWTVWTKELVNAPGESTAIPITMASLGSSVYQSHVGTDGKVYTRSSTNGINWTVWTKEIVYAPGESTAIPITMASYDDDLYQSHVGTDGKVYNRSSTDGVHWTVWTREMTNAPGESTRIPITMTSLLFFGTTGRG